ncbi:hypothetical protein NDU88_004483 [Pleurodeles waltl]|uniref:Uncharacterized protein n=1 Tax=Pleurodeles waltl TaxID=8319 RepID=A0AAV7RIA2_PLEWA|nr:hypothetical protein NDU88_004483 [Pleurodeles waltl]
MPREAGALVAYLGAGDGTKITGTVPVALFANYYQELYEADPTSPREDLHTFIQDLTMPRLSPEDRDSLEVEVIYEELLAVLAQLQAGKAPGPNKFQTEFRRLVWPQSGPLLLEVFR